MVDVQTGRRFPRLKLLCLGYLTSAGVIATGKGDRPALFVSVAAQGLSITVDRARIVEINLQSYAMTQSAAFTDVGRLVSGLGEIWITIGGGLGPYGSTLVGLNPRTLAVEHRLALAYSYIFQPFDGYVWIAAGTRGLLRYDPADGSLVHVPLVLAPSNSVMALSASSRLLYLGVSGRTGSDNALDSYSPATGLVTRYPQGSLTGYVPASGPFAWVFPPGGNASGVFAATLPPTRDPFWSGASCAGWNGTWSAYFDANEAMFCEQSGVPMTCASGRTGQVLADLTVPGTIKPSAGAPGTSPHVLAVGAGLLVLAATQVGVYESDGLAFYRLDPRCHSA
jgi:hypothetical protein